MATKTVLLTGATGFIGLRILQGLLEQRYNVRAAVRSEAKATWLAERVRATVNDSEALFTQVIVPNFVKEGAFDEAVDGVDYIIHVASPITSSDDPKDWEQDFVTTAIEGNVRLLEAASRAGTVDRIVFTSSMVAILPLRALFMDPGDVILDAESRSQNMQPPYPAKMMAYAAGKIAALNRAESWVAENKPKFDIINICPSFVTGRDDTVTTAQELCKGSNWHSLSIILGTQQALAKPALTCHIDDVVRCHVLALDPAVPGNQSFLVSTDGSDGESWDDAKAAVAARFPAAVERGILPNDGHMPTVKTRLDVKKTEDVFKFKHISYLDQVIEVVEQYLKLHGQDKEQDREPESVVATAAANEPAKVDVEVPPVLSDQVAVAQ